jgi:hypothetical protein
MIISKLNSFFLNYLFVFFVTQIGFAVTIPENPLFKLVFMIMPKY